MKNVVVIGGGTGLSAMMAGLKDLDDVSLTAIITVADDGGSTGRIRDTYNVPAMGDIRHVMCAMGEDDDDSLFSGLMNYRFSGSEDIGGHQLGNLIFLAMMDITGSFMGAVEAMSRVLKVKGTILPSTLDNATLYALMEDGTLVRGEKNIPNSHNSISRVFYQQNIEAFPRALEAIASADLIIYGIGSLYTSILPNIIIDDVARAVYDNLCPKVYFCNAMTQPGETDGFSLEDHARALEKHTCKNCVDTVVVNCDDYDAEVLERYQKMGSVPVRAEEDSHPYRVLKRHLTLIDEKGRIRHNPAAVREAVQELLNELPESHAEEAVYAHAGDVPPVAA